jgi:Zn-finger protein
MIWCRCGHPMGAHHDGREDCVSCKCPYYRPAEGDGYDSVIAKESVPKIVDSLDALLVIYIAQSMLGEEEICAR